jgi:hypothetical protein
MIAYAEKRDFLRMPIDCSFSFSTEDDSREFKGKVINLSNKGILFTSNLYFTAGTLLNIVLTPSHSKTSPIHATASVVRARNNEMVFEVACRFTSISAQSAP